jgi:hypothetical protein
MPQSCDRLVYFPSEGRRARDFFARKIRLLRPGLNPQTWVPEASALTTRPQKPLNHRTEASTKRYEVCCRAALMKERHVNLGYGNVRFNRLNLSCLSKLFSPFCLIIYFSVCFRLFAVFTF